MKRILLLFAAVAATFQASTAMGARAIVTDPAFVPDDTWLLVKLRNDLIFAQPPVIPDYAAHLFVDDNVYTPLPATGQFWLPKERPAFVLEFQPSDTAGDFSEHDLTTEINALADVVEIYNEGPGVATGLPFDFFRYQSYKGGSPLGTRQILTHTFSIPEPASAALVACGGLMMVIAGRRSSRLT
jgi:hypothetical protein